MKRSPFKRPDYQRPPRAPLVPRAEPVRATMTPSIRFIEPVLKDEPVRSEAYRRFVAALPCWRCGIEGYSQAAHGDEGKGMGIKACDLTCWPGCGPHDGLPGCHHFVGTSGSIAKQDRRRLESQAAADTQAALILLSHSDRKLRAVLVAVGLVR